MPSILPPEPPAQVQPEPYYSDDAREAIREALLALMRQWSESVYCAGWLTDLEARLHAHGGRWEAIGRAVGWPIGCDAKFGWESWDEAAARYGSDEWVATHKWAAGGVAQ